MTAIHFIHAADLHLDSPFRGMTGLPPEQLNRLRASTFTAFERLIDHACETQVDFVLFVGDIYDGEDRSLRAQLKFREGMERLAGAGIPAFISYGNHDHLNGTWTRFDLPPNVHVFDSDVSEAKIRVGEKEVSIYGFSYPERHVREVMVDRYPVAEDEESFHIGMLHGSVAGEESHAVYAPFTKSELLAKRYDYWALGHIHLRQVLHEDPPIVYPGNLQGRHRHESGVKGFYEVELTEVGASLTFIETSAIVFERIEVSCGGIRHANEWLEACGEALQQIARPCIAEMSMVDIDHDASELFNQSSAEEWLDVLQEVAGESEPFRWVQSITFQQPIADSSRSGVLLQSVLDEMDGWTEQDWKDVLKEVYQHARTVKHLDVLTGEEMAELKEGAKKILRTELARGK